jgi:hypothetical protein
MESVTTPQKFYVIEHFETEFSRWTYCEYVNMILAISNFYNDSN